MRNYFKHKFSDFFFFYKYLGSRIFINLFLSVVVSLLDGLGLAMFIPLLQLLDESERYQSDSGNAGNMDYFIQALESLGLSMNLGNVLLLILFFFTLKGLFRYISSYYDVHLSVIFIRKVQLESVNIVSNLNYNYFVKLDAGKIQNSLSSEISRIYNAYKNYSASIQTMITVFVYLLLAVITNPQFAVLVMIGGALSNLVYREFYKKTKEASTNITIGFHTYHSFIIQQLQNFKYLRSTGQINIYNSKIKAVVNDLAEENRRIGFYSSILYASREPLAIFVVIGVIFIQIIFFGTSLGPIILSLLFFYRSLNQIIIFQNLWNSFLNFSGSLSSYKELMNDLNMHQVVYESGEKIKYINQIELHDISFSYGDKLLLKDIRIIIPKNKTIAFVGSSGSGKTTLTNIITGLLQVQKGEVLVNNVNLNNINIQTYQSRIGYISQEPVIFNDTLFNNVTFWAEKNSQNFKKFLSCIDKASLKSFMSGLDKAEDSPLGNNGVMVSGGQRQRIAIARELYKSVDLLILDEATSSLDSGTEKEIQLYLDGLKGELTMVIIAHRLSTIKNADVIYLLDDGKIEAQGDFNYLKEHSDDFRKMVELQDFIDENKL